jgi:hypothetical protein
MKGEVVDVLARFLDHLRRSAAVAPAYELDGRIDLSHRLAELNRFAHRQSFLNRLGE